MEDYKVAVKLTLVNEMSVGLLAISSQFKVLGKYADAFSLKLKGIQSSFMTGGKMMTAGFALAAPFIYAISKAAELQKQMIGIQIATHGTTEEMNRMRLAVETASVPTQFSAITVAQIAKQVSTSNSFNANQLTNLLPAIAKFADVQSLLKNTDPMSSATDAVKLMHLAQKYAPKDVEPYFDMITKTSLMMPGGVGELRSALSYFQPMGKSALGVGDKDSLMLVALLSRLGLSGSRGGTNLLAAMTRTIPGIFGSGLMHGKSHEALSDLGFIDKSGHSIFMEKGKFNSQEWVQALSATAARFIKEDPIHGRERFMIDYQHAFGTQGGRAAGLFSSAGAVDQLASMNSDFEQLANMGAIQDKYVKSSVSQQFTSAMTNFQNAMIELGTTLLPATSKGLTELNNHLKPMIEWMQSHQNDVKAIAKDFLYLAGIMGAGGVLYMAMAAFTALTSPIGILLILITQWKTVLNGLKLTFHAVIDGLIWDIQQLKKYLTPGSSTGGNSNQFFVHNTQGTTVHSHFFLDNKEIAHGVTKILANGASQQPAHGSVYNGNIGLSPNMINAQGYS